MKGIIEARIEINGNQVKIFYPDSLYWFEIEQYFKNKNGDDD